MPPPRRRRAALDLEAQLAQLRALAGAPDTPALRAALLAALQGASSPACARAADIIGHRGLDGFTEALRAAWRRLSTDGLRQDPGCLGRRAVLTALDRLDAEMPDILAEAARLFQPEPAWGPPVDTAPPVRARAALALGRAWGAAPALLLAELLADPTPVVRRAAIEAIQHRGEPLLAALLVLRHEIPDPDPVVRAECLSALLRLAPEDGLARAEALLRSGDPDDAVEQKVVALALAESRQPEALACLLRWLDGLVRDERRAVAIVAVAAHRSEEARRFLLDLIADTGALSDARHAIRALAPLAFTDLERDRLLQAAAQRGDALRALARQCLAEADAACEDVDAEEDD